MATLKEMTANLRKRFKREKIKARVRMSPGASDPCIQVFGVTPEYVFSEHEQRTIRFIANCNRLTRPRGEPIDIERMTDPQHFHFYLPVAA